MYVYIYFNNICIFNLKLIYVCTKHKAYIAYSLFYNLLNDNAIYEIQYIFNNKQVIKST